MSEPDVDWKRRVLEDFGHWLDGLEEDAGDGGAGMAPEPDLRDLFAELAALRQEVRLQNREQSKAGRELALAAARYDGAAALMKRREEDLAAFEARVCREAENRCLRSVLDVRDALARGLEAANAMRERPGLFRRLPRGIRGVAEGYEVALRRFDRMLAGFGVERLRTAGRPFDARTMHAAEVCRVAGLGNGMVVEELLGGYTRDGDILRLAEVAVNRDERQERS